LGAARPTTDTASQYTTADKPEVTASYTSQEVTTSLFTPYTPKLTRPHMLLIQPYVAGCQNVINMI